MTTNHDDRQPRIRETGPSPEVVRGELGCTARRARPPAPEWAPQWEALDEQGQLLPGRYPTAAQALGAAGDWPVRDEVAHHVPSQPLRISYPASSDVPPTSPAPLGLVGHSTWELVVVALIAGLVGFLYGVTL